MFILGLCLLMTIIHVQGECNGGCSEPILFYENIDCKPVFASSDDCCPSHYDCSQIEQRAKSDAEICHFNGKIYNAFESINDDEIYGNCKVGCRCRRKQSGNMGFRCAILDCPEWLGLRPTQGCHLKYELDKCCNVGKVCGSSDISCKVDGKTYYEGQQFSPSNTKCTECICKSGFEGKYEAPFCKKKSCIEEVDHQKEIKNFCAPSYISKGDCCPFNWICPEDSDIIIAAKNPSKNPDLKCKFGKHNLGIGDTFSRTSGKGKLSCECIIPPYLTCIQNYDYPSYAPEY
ncbi:hypothetical protein ILUMI_10076 [Ignelater luminosus]|uniref:VWFC domain-containing protein n=1 Tax=Ignelater luminosus TaxID=2038154 RepID=A0A8K0GFC0_IGNLU|nr:hypothetical protein ILUMI_10076 [Ignelater luminosus]